ncbi:MAG: serine acetyltransferase [Colwellia sp.]|nr:serine acetyltransferase [Colwellia sp.]
MKCSKDKFYLDALFLYRIYSIPSIRRIPMLSKLLEGINYFIFNCSVPASAIIGKGTFFSHRGMSVVIHKQSIIGENCTIGTCVTLGGKGKGIDGAPIVGNNVTISTGAKLLGAISVADGAVIGANSVVLNNVHENATVVGIPGKEI